ncbi:MAG: GGDEF domain-containing protein, partial [Alphaproteobacteria bacterium]|nr:GGDEF domain-containing protein [Alphaproteobacteria bacterium]
VTRFLKIRFVPELNWFLCVEKDEAGAIADIRRALYLNLLICLVVTAFAIGAITLFVNRYQTRLEMAATTDRLTGLANRHSYEILVAQALKEAERAPGPLSIALFDIDDFKKINDSRGHMVGDEVLRAVADLARASLREADILCRWGGEEFIAVLKNCGRDDAAILGEWIRTRIAAADLTAGPSPIRATVSVGVAQRAAGEDEPALMARADRALLAAKAAGKNMVRVD